jgi:ribulose-phosphate 3-epimerase
MSIHPGFSGQDSLSNALKKIQHLDDLLGAREYLIEVDGENNSENIASIRAAGANVSVLGSYIFPHSDRSAVIANLKKIK